MPSEKEQEVHDQVAIQFQEQRVQTENLVRQLANLLALGSGFKPLAICAGLMAGAGVIMAQAFKEERMEVVGKCWRELAAIGEDDVVERWQEIQPASNGNVDEAGGV